MRILERRHTFIHTHFLTDCEKLPREVGRELQRDTECYLRERGIVYGVHFEETKSERGLRIVLECIPLPSVLDKIHRRRQRLVRPIPRRPRPVTRVRLLRSSPKDERAPTNEAMDRVLLDGKTQKAIREDASKLAT